MEEEIILLNDFLKGDFQKDKLEHYKGSYKLGFFYYRDIQQAIENLLKAYKQYENKLMFALSPTTHELASETQRNFKKIIAQNIDEDTYTIKKELKKYWNHMDTYWEVK